MHVVPSSLSAPVRVPVRLWFLLGAMVLAQAATTVVAAAPAFLIPYLHEHEGLSLATAGLLAGAPNLGLVLALVAWGAATDRFGERRVILIGLALTGATVAAAMLADGLGALGIALVACGAASACTNSASGRLITGWFPTERRGLAMGIRQTCQPLGMAIAALGVPPLALAFGVSAALGLGGALVVLSFVVCVLLVRDPARPPRAAAAESGSPYRASNSLVRIHAASMLLVVPQFALSTFGLVWFTVGFGWSALAAGALVAFSQFAGAAGRIVVGIWSDRAGSRLRPLRIVAIAGVVTLAAAAGFGWLEWGIPAAVLYVIASCVSVADNGLAFTAVAEIAGPSWAGRALGFQNTGQFLAAAAVGPAVGAAIGVIGIPAALALVALTPALAVPLVPKPSAELVRA
ncbi:sugar phosphate permease [Leucobacter luti]|uniref:Sugar phosphate permease n=1 Tax=Leucobacter luti TaxID=340320 RepID=A0A4R6S142_9MICO|nr:MFS transporter [Leucobacter luti]TDP92687.1 sugar phosphate permease [Leucobacter luti]